MNWRADWRGFIANAPMIRTTGGLILGICTCYFFSWQLNLLLLLLLSVGSGIAVVIFRRRTSVVYIKTVLFLSTFIVIGQILMHLSLNREIARKANIHQTKKQFIGRILDIPIPSERWDKVIVDVVIPEHENSAISSPVMIYLEKNDSNSYIIKPGDFVMCSGSLSPIIPPKNPMAFDYRWHLRKKGIQYQLWIRDSNWSFYQHEYQINPKRFAFKINNALKEVLRRNIDDENTLSISNALLLGDRELIERETASSFSKTGTIHVLAVSGLHVGIIYLVLSFTLRWMRYNQSTRLIRCVLLIGLIWLYAMVTGLAPSVVRSATMFTFVILGSSTNSKISIYNSISASAFLMLVHNPMLLFDVGFQLSYSAVFGIVYLQPKLFQLIRFNNKWLDWIWKLMTVSIAAQIATAPLGVYYFNLLSFNFLVSNLFVIPLITLALYLGISLLILHKLSGLAWLLSIAFKWTIHCILFIVDFIANWHWSYSESVFLSTPELLCVYGLILGSLVFIRLRKWTLLPLPLSFLVVMMGMDFTQPKQEKSNNVVYHVNRETLISFQEDNHVLYLSSLPTTDAPDFLQKIHLAQNLESRIWKSIPSGISHFNHGKISVGFLHSEVPHSRPVMPVKVDYLVISGNPKLFLEDLDQYFRTSSLVIDGSNPSWKIQYWKSDARRLGYDLWCTQERGYFSGKEYY